MYNFWCSENMQQIYRSKFTRNLQEIYRNTHAAKHPPIHPSTQPNTSIHPSIPSIHPTHPSIHSTHPPIHPPTHPPTHPCSNPPTHPPTHEITRRHGCSAINFLHVFKTPLPKNICRWLLLKIENAVKCRNINFFIFNNRQEESFQRYFLKPKAVRYFKPFLRDATFSS